MGKDRPGLIVCQAQKELDKNSSYGVGARIGPLLPDPSVELIVTQPILVKTFKTFRLTITSVSVLAKVAIFAMKSVALRCSRIRSKTFQQLLA